MFGYWFCVTRCEKRERPAEKKVFFWKAGRIYWNPVATAWPYDESIKASRGRVIQR